MPATSLVLFDIDGTLMRNAGAHHREALVAGIRAVMNLETTLEGVPTSGMLDRDLIRAMMLAAGVSERQVLRKMSTIVRECQSHYLRNCAGDLSDRVCGGVTEFVQALKERGAALGIVTGNLQQIGWKKLELAGLRHYFSLGAFAEDARTRTRLAKIAFNRAVREGSVTRSCRVSLVGDHFNDIEAARANKFLSVAVATGLTSYEDLRARQPDIVVNDLTELDPGLLL